MVAVAAALAVHIALFGSVVRCGVVFPVVGVLVFTVAARFERTTALWALAGGLAIIFGMAARRRDRVRRRLAARAADDRGLRAGARRLRAQPHGARAEGPHPGAARGARRARAPRGGDRPHAPLGRARRPAGPPPGRADPAGRRRPRARRRRRRRHRHPRADRGGQPRTLDEMREIVGVLRDDDAPTSPAPTLTSLRALVLRDKGDAARLTVEGSPRVLPAGVELSAYRIVEHLLERPRRRAGRRGRRALRRGRARDPRRRARRRAAATSAPRSAAPASARSCTAARSTPARAAAAPRRSPCCPSRPPRDVRRPVRTDVLIGALAALFGAAGAVAVGQGPLAWLGAAALGAALGLYRRHPAGAAALAVAAVRPRSCPPATCRRRPPYSCAPTPSPPARRTVLWASVAAAIGLLAASLAAAVLADNADGWLVPAILLVGTAWIAGRAIRERDLVAEPPRRARRGARPRARGVRRALGPLRARAHRLRAARHRRPRDQRHGRAGRRRPAHRRRRPRADGRDVPGHRRRRAPGRAAT